MQNCTCIQNGTCVSCVYLEQYQVCSLFAPEPGVSDNQAVTGSWGPARPGEPDLRTTGRGQDMRYRIYDACRIQSGGGGGGEGGTCTDSLLSAI